MKKSIITTLALAIGISVAGASTGWTLTATEADSTTYSAPAIGNGQIGLVMDQSGLKPQRMFSSTAVERGHGTKISSVIETILPVNLIVAANGKSEPVRNWQQSLDMSNGTVTTSYAIPGAEVRCSINALRSLPFATLVRVEVKALESVTITVTDSPIIPEHIGNATISERKFKAGHKPRNILRAEGTYNKGVDAMVSSFGFISDGWTTESPYRVLKSLKKGETAELWAVASTVTTADFADPWNESERQVLYAMTTGPEALLERHNSAWSELWKGNVSIAGNDELQEHARAALYNLYSSVQPGSGRSIAPMGLTSKHYYGHIFWDADTWILPVMAILQPEVARDMVNYRIATLGQARKRAAAHGYAGAMYPWESDDLGEESTPTFALTGPLEHHVTADVSRGAWLYFCASKDTTWLREKAWPLLRDCADFWTSRAEKNPDGSYSIKSVVGADEYAIGVNDNAFTNAAAVKALDYAEKAAAVLGLNAPDSWTDVRKAIKFHYIPGTEIIAEYEGYDGEKIKQADVALLAFPLEILTSPDEIERNLSYYDTKIDSLHGPAMSHSAMSVNYARMGNGEKAGRLVERSYKPNLRGPFHNLSESPGNNHTYFMTGAGGLIQALVFGYAGLDITDNGITQKPATLPKSVKGITVATPTGIYHNGKR
ncbi:MAG: glycoside hydrolase family 65 protein [Firmicutes bacterium]|nr:glycoside hydrolase family 65 protein [Bacillota bacterium]MCM1476910.1 glycoside hydrolase family 65 protein [Bacteroides sp.]